MHVNAHMSLQCHDVLRDAILETWLQLFNSATTEVNVPFTRAAQDTDAILTKGGKEDMPEEAEMTCSSTFRARKWGLSNTAW